MDAFTLEKHENLAYSQDTLIAKTLQECLREIRILQHQLNDPTFIYAGSRIQRSAILCRNAEITELNNTVANLKLHIQNLEEK